MLPLFSSAQDVINIERFREAQGVTMDGEMVRKLYDARLSTGNVEMVCDSAWQFINRGEVRAFGNIQIDTGDEMIWADTLYYYNNRDLSLLRGRVVILQDSTTLFGDEVDYNFLTKVAIFNKGIRMEDQDGTLIAQGGTYFQNQDSAVFRGQVQVADSAQYAEGDSLFVNRKNQFLQLYSNIFVADSSNNGILTGDYLEADSTGRRYVDGNGYMRRISADTTDTTHINAAELLLQEEDSTNTIFGYQNVRVWSQKFSSISDTLKYDSETEVFQLISNPKAWHKNIQLTGPYISVQMDSSEVEQLLACHKTIAVQEDSATGRLHQIKGDTLVADFTDGNISKIRIYPNSQVLYHTKNENDEPDGAVQYSSPHTTMYFSNGDLQRVLAGKNNGYFFEEFDGLADRQLEGFAWNPEERPHRPDREVAPRFDPVPLNPPFELPERFTEFLNNQEQPVEMKE
ncbi:OstA-like protein [Gracilimonas mengyeensis]|uniref:Lipopolysaccharide export system protein LptA n=1 Tax=Gracilimonas mengyeensis TaxID=1302730 RepID=A0A521FGU1_9BACT|nr:OstA-like protein [Gracilimonas mengyeensis]SMO95392.1 Lipopolysaccharide export system protein LptA [Gracilimonas mengyeensis]